jgi:hypothetical protein
MVVVIVVAAAADRVAELLQVYILADDKELRYLYSSPSIIKIIKSRRMRWAGHVALMGRRGTHIDYWWESQRERDH